MRPGDAPLTRGEWGGVAAIGAAVVGAVMVYNSGIGADDLLWIGILVVFALVAVGHFFGDDA